jgi:hypothetical protein
MSLGSLERLPLIHSLKELLISVREKEVKEVYQSSLRSVEGVIIEQFLQLINRPDIVLACVSKTLRNKVKRDNLVLRTCYNIQNKYIFLESGRFKVYCYYISSLALEF